MMALRASASVTCRYKSVTVFLTSISPQNLGNRCRLPLPSGRGAGALSAHFVPSEVGTSASTTCDNNRSSRAILRSIEASR